MKKANISEEQIQAKVRELIEKGFDRVELMREAGILSNEIMEEAKLKNTESSRVEKMVKIARMS